MSGSMGLTRLRKEYHNLKTKDITPCILACPLEKNVLEWRFVLRGCEDTDYFGGHYHGILKFPSEYPMAPPSIMMVTPSGRFKCNTRICMSISDFHPETWCPAWTVSTILTGILSFMNSDELTTGGLQGSSGERRRFAAASKQFNSNDKLFVSLFGTTENVEESFREIDERIEANKKKILNKKNPPSDAKQSHKSESISSETKNQIDNTASTKDDSISSDVVMSKAAKKRARAKKASLNLSNADVIDTSDETSPNTLQLSTEPPTQSLDTNHSHDEQQILDYDAKEHHYHQDMKDYSEDYCKEFDEMKILSDEMRKASLSFK